MRLKIKTDPLLRFSLFLNASRALPKHLSSAQWCPATSGDAVTCNIQYCCAAKQCVRLPVNFNFEVATTCSKPAAAGMALPVLVDLMAQAAAAAAAPAVAMHKVKNVAYTCQGAITKLKEVQRNGNLDG